MSDQMQEVVDALRSALERTEANLMAAVRSQPIRDLSENLAENHRALDMAEGMDGGGSDG